MSPSLQEFLTITVVFLSISVILIVFLYFRHRARSEVQLTIRNAIDKDQVLSPDTIERLITPPRSEDSDLRRGAVFLAVGLAFVVFAFMVDDESAIRPLVGIGSFPGLIGVAFLLLHLLRRKDNG